MITYSIIISNHPVSGQTDTIYIPGEVQVDEVEIIGQRSPGIYPDLARVVSVIPKDEIESAPVQSFNDLLEFLPSIDIRQRGNLDVQADIGIRGGSFDQTLILINGIPFNDTQTGHHNLNLPFDINDIEKIEVLEGPGSRVYGANAFSGAVNIVTKTGNKNTGKLSASAGQNDFFKTCLSKGITFKKLENYVGFSASSSAGYTDNTDFQNYKAFYTVNYQSAIGKFEIQAGYLNKAFGANSFYTSLYPEQYEKIKSRFLAFDYSTGKSVITKFTFAWRRHQDKFELFREDRYHYINGYYVNGTDTAAYAPGSYYPGHNYHLTNSFFTGINTTIPGKSGSSSLGIEYHNNHILSNILGLSLESPVSVPGEPNMLFTKGATRELYNLFLEHTRHFGSFYISGGALLSYNNDYGHNTFWGGELSKKIRSHGKLFFSVNQSLRLPTFTDLYYSGPVNIGNPDLKPEKAITFEGGYRLNLKRITIELSAFNRKGKNVIDWVKLPDEQKYTTRNHIVLNTSGFEISSGINTHSLPLLGFLIKNLSVNYSYLSTSKSSGEYISAYALDYLKHKLSVRAGQQIFRSINLYWNLTYQQRNGTYPDKEGTEQSYKPFLLTDAKLSWNPGFAELYLEASNLFDVRYRDFGSIVQPGFWLFAGMNITFGPPLSE